VVDGTGLQDYFGDEPSRANRAEDGSIGAVADGRGDPCEGECSLTVASDSVTGEPLPKVHLALVATDDWTAIPAHLNWGGRIAGPHPEYHVAALRSGANVSA
jgi:hypothetical protein